MRTETILQGRSLSGDELAQLRTLLTEHPSFGHAQQPLASRLAALNLLAFLFHTVLGFTGEPYRLIRAALPARKTFFQDARALTRYLYFPSWVGLLRFMLRGLEIGPYAKAT